MADVTYEKATLVYPGAEKATIDSMDLHIEDGEFMVLVGPSGSGKSTALRMLAGLEEVSSGTIHIGDRDVTHMPPKDRDIAMVFQNYALYPHMTVADNMGFALKIAGVNKAEIRQKVEEARSEEHTSELQPRQYLVCRLLLEKKKTTERGLRSFCRRLFILAYYSQGLHETEPPSTGGDRIAVDLDGALRMSVASTRRHVPPDP